MTRDAPIPLFLWACAALVVHAVGGGGAKRVVEVEEDHARQRAEIREMVRGVQREFGVIELEIPKDADKKKDEDPEKVEVEPLTFLEVFRDSLLDSALLAAGLESDSKKEEPLAEAEKPKPEPPKPAEELAAKPDPAEEKPPEEKKEEDKPKDLVKPAELVIVKDNRISIRQITEKDQPDNPNAPRLADQAAHVLEETQSKDRSTDQVSKNPSPGSNQRGPENQEGNGEQHKIAQAEEKPGEDKRAPGESSPHSRDHQHNEPTPPAQASANQGGGAGRPGASSPGGAAANDASPSRAVVGAPGGRGPFAPDTFNSENGFSEEIPEEAPGGDGVSNTPGQMLAARPGVFVPIAPKSLGLGVKGGPGGPLNLSWQGFVKAVGEEQLDKQRAAIGKSIRSQRPGQFDTNKFARWLPDIENYDPSVKLGDSTQLNAAHSPFASYLSTIHNAIHPVFAEEFLPSLNKLGKAHELNEELVAHVEIILTKDEGKVVRMGITKNSGSTVFDAAALEAIDRKQPFGAAPAGIESADGHVYLHWEFHRDPVDACSTRNATPLKVLHPKPIVKNLPSKKPLLKPLKPGEAPDASGPLVPMRKPTGAAKPTKSK